MRVRLPVLLLLMGLAGCASVRAHLPWHRASEPPPAPVTELAVVAPEQGVPAVVLQFREGNTLVVDLTQMPPAGTLGLRPGGSGQWPVRMALRLAPGRVGEVEVRGAQRVVYPVTAEGSRPVTVQLPPALHAAGTPELTVRWGAKDAF